MNNPIKTLTKREWCIWLFSLTAVIVSNLISEFDIFTLVAATVGVTSLIFAAKGNVWAQILMIVFSILYGIISFRFRYWGEMMTYLGMTLPMAVWSTVTWLKNPSEKNGNEVQIQKLGKKQVSLVVLIGIVVTMVFGLILSVLDTPNLVFSTVSVLTSFLAVTLTMLRSSFYALGYAANDLVLIVMWILASLDEPGYIPVAVNFCIFFVNDMYGFISWKKREVIQAEK